MATYIITSEFVASKLFSCDTSANLPYKTISTEEFVMNSIVQEKLVDNNTT